MINNESKVLPLAFTEISNMLCNKVCLQNGCFVLQDDIALTITGRK
jgi:hypothetical protein